MTNTIQVIIHSETQPQVSIQDNNGIYNYRGKMLPDEKIEYLPGTSYSSSQPNTWVADFNVMCLQPDSEAILKISDATHKPLFEEKLIKGLLGANPNIDFNRDHDFTIEITFDSYDIPISILVNDWEIIAEEI